MLINMRNAMMMAGSLPMKGDDIRTSFSKGFNMSFRVLHHQMHIENSLARGAQGFYYQRTQRDIGYEAAVHHVDMDVFGTSIGDFLDFVGQMCKIGGQNRWCYLNHLYSFFRFNCCVFDLQVLIVIR